MSFSALRNSCCMVVSLISTSYQWCSDWSMRSMVPQIPLYRSGIEGSGILHVPCLPLRLWRYFLRLHVQKGTVSCDICFSVLSADPSDNLRYGLKCLSRSPLCFLVPDLWDAPETPIRAAFFLRLVANSSAIISIGIIALTHPTSDDIVRYPLMISCTLSL